MANYAGNSNSSSLEFEPLNILQDLSMDVNVFVPEVADGQPAAGYIDEVTCVVTSPTDPTLNHVEIVDIALQNYDHSSPTSMGRAVQ